MRTPQLPIVDWTDATGRFKWTRPFRRNEVWFLSVCHHIWTGLYYVQVRRSNSHCLCFQLEKEWAPGTVWPLWWSEKLFSTQGTEPPSISHSAISANKPNAASDKFPCINNILVGLISSILFRRVLHLSLYNTLHENPPSGRPGIPWGLQTNRQAYMTHPIAAFRNYAKARINWFITSYQLHSVW